MGVVWRWANGGHGCETAILVLASAVLQKVRFKSVSWGGGVCVPDRLLTEPPVFRLRREAIATQETRRWRGDDGRCGATCKKINSSSSSVVFERHAVSMVRDTNTFDLFSVSFPEVGRSFFCYHGNHVHLMSPHCFMLVGSLLLGKLADTSVPLFMYFFWICRVLYNTFPSLFPFCSHLKTRTRLLNAVKVVSMMYYIFNQNHLKTRNNDDEIFNKHTFVHFLWELLLVML